MNCPKCNHQVITFFSSFLLKRQNELTCPNCHSKVFLEKKPEFAARIVMAFIVAIGIAFAGIYFRGQVFTILAVSIAFALLGQFVYLKLLKLYVVE